MIQLVQIRGMLKRDIAKIELWVDHYQAQKTVVIFEKSGVCKIIRLPLEFSNLLLC